MIFCPYLRGSARGRVEIRGPAPLGTGQGHRPNGRPGPRRGWQLIQPHPDQSKIIAISFKKNQIAS